MLSGGNTCIVNPTSGWTQIDLSSDLSGGLVVNTSATASGTCGSYTYFGNMTST
jgi:hypothetical protein